MSAHPSSEATAELERGERLGGARGNERLTSATGAVLSVLLAAEGVTILWLGGLLTEHMFIGVLLIGPVLLKLASTGYRVVRYYAHARPYREQGPPPLTLRLLAPVLVAATVLIFASGIALLIAGHHSDLLLGLHKVGFIVWAACFGVHFLAHAPQAWRSLCASASPHARMPGAGLRSGLVSVSLGGGVVLALALLGLIEAWHGSAGG